MLTDFYEQGSIFSFYVGRSFTLVNNEAAADLTTEKLWQLFFFFSFTSADGAPGRRFD